MHTAWILARYGLVLLVLTSLTHYVLWRWIRRTFPDTARRHRRWLLPVIGVLAVSSLVRLVSYFTPMEGLSWLVGAILIWHLSVGVMTIPAALFYAALWARDRFRRSEPKTCAQADVPKTDALDVSRQATGPARLPLSLPRRHLLEGASGLALLGGSGVALGRGFVSSRFDIEVVTLPLRVPKLPRALDGYTIVQLSDLHVGTYFDADALDHALATARRLRPDLYVVTGDIVDLHTVYVGPTARLLADLQARHGVVAVLGNHDYYAGADAVIQGLRGTGVEVLVNASKRVASGLWIAGLDDVSGRYRVGGGPGPEVDLALREIDEGDATVLLAHQPHLFERAAHRVDVQLSGHTHGGQIRPGFTPSKLIYPYVSGRYERAGATMWVNRGLGVGGTPTRIGARPEITRVVLVSG